MLASTFHLQSVTQMNVVEHVISLNHLCDFDSPCLAEWKRECELVDDFCSSQMGQETFSSDFQLLPGFGRTFQEPVWGYECNQGRKCCEASKTNKYIANILILA